MKYFTFIIVILILYSCKKSANNNCIVGSWKKMSGPAALSFSEGHYVTDGLPLPYRISHDTIYIDFKNPLVYSCNEMFLDLYEVDDSTSSFNGRFIRVGY